VKYFCQLFIILIGVCKSENKASASRQDEKILPKEKYLTVPKKYHQDSGESDEEIIRKQNEVVTQALAQVKQQEIQKIKKKWQSKKAHLEKSEEIGLDVKGLKAEVETLEKKVEEKHQEFQSISTANLLQQKDRLMQEQDELKKKLAKKKIGKKNNYYFLRKKISDLRNELLKPKNVKNKLLSLKNNYSKNQSSKG